MNNNKYLFSLLISCLIVSLYQIPILDNFLDKHNININLTEKFSEIKDFQQDIENFKINFFSENSIETKNDTHKKLVMHNQNSINSSPLVSIQDNKNSINSSPLVPIQDNKNSINSSPLVPIQDNKSINNLEINKNSINIENKFKEKNSCKENCIVLLMGDSVVGDIYYSTQRLIKKSHPDWNVIDAHKVSSGLCNKKYYDWELTTKNLLEKHHPDYTIVLLGTNDGQGMMSGKKGFMFGSSDWINEYTNRTQSIIDLLEKYETNWYWLDLPVDKNSDFNNRMQVIRNIQKQLTNENYLHLEKIFGKSDGSESFDESLRAHDGIHLNSKGADLIAKEIINIWEK
jgi:hypothetical protein